MVAKATQAARKIKTMLLLSSVLFYIIVEFNEVWYCEGFYASGCIYKEKHCPNSHLKMTAPIMIIFFRGLGYELFNLAKNVVFDINTFIYKYFLNEVPFQIKHALKLHIF